MTHYCLSSCLWVAELFGIKVERVWDVGVAGIHRSLTGTLLARCVLPFPMDDSDSFLDVFVRIARERSNSSAFLSLATTTQEPSL